VSPFFQIGQLAKGDAEKFGMKLLGENDVEGTLKKLDRLIHDEAGVTAAQTLKIVYLLVQNMRTFMDSEWIVSPFITQFVLNVCPLDGMASHDSVRQIQGVCLLREDGVLYLTGYQR
jgi:hypothetical protein